MNFLRVAVGGGVRRQGGVVWAKKTRRGRDDVAEERVDTHSFARKAGESAELFPEAVLFRKVRSVHSFPARLLAASRCFCLAVQPGR
jgi:hypothetical protein